VELWRERADTKLAGLKTAPGTVVPPCVLPWPEADEKLNHPREHLASLLGKDQADLGLDPIAGSRRFQFKQGTWRDAATPLDPPPVEESEP
jgi:hypothetical protein